MKQIDRDQIVNGRRLAIELMPYVTGEAHAILLTDVHREAVGDLLNQFERLVKAEAKQNKARAKNAQKAGRPVGDKGPHPVTVWRRKRAGRK